MPDLQNKEIAFTLCSNNYLAQAITVGNSFLEYHPEFIFVIGLVDRLNAEIDKASFDRFTIIPVEDLAIKEFDELKNKYNVSELNTAVKPSYFRHLFKKYNAGKIIYIDPDIWVTSRFDEVIDGLDSRNIILTPHIFTPIEDDFAPTDYHTLRGGVFNLGFIALSNFPAVEGFLKWWHARVVKYGFNNFSLNMFYDQLWINYVPVLYDNYFILKDPGYNVANWNLHERMISMDTKGNFMVNEKFQLKFFHFSSYSFEKPEIICSYFTRYDFTSRPDLQPVFDAYRKLLLRNNIEAYSKSRLFFYPEINRPAIAGPVNKQSIVRRVYNRLKRTIKPLKNK